MPSPLDVAVRAVADATGFAGVVRVDQPGHEPTTWAFGLADRAQRVAFRADHRVAVASAAKTFTALTVLSLVADGVLALATPVRSLLGSDLPLIDDAVTVEHLLAHRSGIGDYLDEDLDGDPDDLVLTVPAVTLDGTEAYLAVLGGFPPVAAPGERFQYCNGGYVVLALVAERATGTRFENLVADRVCRPAGLERTGFLRSDEPLADLAVGYLSPTGPRTNVFHLPVLGSGDGGLSTTVDDVHRFWAALFGGRIVAPDVVAQATRSHGVSEGGDHYGLGFWIEGAGPVVGLEGCDAGVSFRSTHDPTSGRTTTVAANTSGGAWPLARLLRDLGTSASEPPSSPPI